MRQAHHGRRAPAGGPADVARNDGSYLVGEIQGKKQALKPLNSHLASSSYPNTAWWQETSSLPARTTEVKHLRAIAAESQAFRNHHHVFHRHAQE